MAGGDGRERGWLLPYGGVAVIQQHTGRGDLMGIDLGDAFGIDLGDAFGIVRW